MQVETTSLYNKIFFIDLSLILETWNVLNVHTDVDLIIMYVIFRGYGDEASTVVWFDYVPRAQKVRVRKLAHERDSVMNRR